MSIKTLSNQKQIELLAAANSFTSKYKSEQNEYQFGTNRKSEIQGQIGDIGQPFEKLYNDYIESL